MKRLCIALTVFKILLAASVSAELRLPNVFTDHMVLQRDQENPIWGWAEAEAKVVVTIDGRKVSTRADGQGNWRATLPALAAGGPYEISVKGGRDKLRVSDVLVGEVWFCSGQSNMEWPISNSYGAEVEIAAANHPQIRLLTVPRKGTDELQDDFEGSWELCTPESVAEFSAVGYHFGQYLQASLGVPVGLIDNAWGGSSAEAWVPRDVLESTGEYGELLDHWDQKVDTFDPEAHADYVKRYEEWVQSGFQGPSMNWNRTVNPVTGQHRPANIYNGMMYPLKGYGIRGVIWYQGESNAGRSEQYRRLFPLMVETWRNEWGQGDFPFYWVQLADYGKTSVEPEDHGWAELREAQTQSMDVLDNSGQAVIIDIGEGRDIHPRDKHTVARRLARWALAKDYDYDIAYQSPRYQSMEREGQRIRIQFEHVSDGGLWSFDTEELQGFAIAGEDKEFVWAKAEIVDGNAVEVWSDDVDTPVAVRYGWGTNPEVNLYDRNGLPVTPFKTDDWRWITEGVVK